MLRHFQSLELNNFAPLIFPVDHPENLCQHFTYNVTLNCEHLLSTASSNVVVFWLFFLSPDPLDVKRCGMNVCRTMLLAASTKDDK